MACVAINNLGKLELASDIDPYDANLIDDDERIIPLVMRLYQPITLSDIQLKIIIDEAERVGVKLDEMFEPTIQLWGTDGHECPVWDFTAHIIKYCLPPDISLALSKQSQYEIWLGLKPLDRQDFGQGFDLLFDVVTSDIAQDLDSWLENFGRLFVDNNKCAA